MPINAEKTSRHPPLYPTQLDPPDIIGHDLVDIFTAHYKAVCNTVTAEGFEKAASKFADVREEIGQAYSRLRNYGYYAGGLDKNGNIRWRQVADSRGEYIHWDSLTDQEVARIMARAEFKLEKLGLRKAREV